MLSAWACERITLRAQKRILYWGGGFAEEGTFMLQVSIRVHQIAQKWGGHSRPREQQAQSFGDVTQIACKSNGK